MKYIELDYKTRLLFYLKFKLVKMFPLKYDEIQDIDIKFDDILYINIKMNKDNERVLYNYKKITYEDKTYNVIYNLL